MKTWNKGKYTALSHPEDGYKEWPSSWRVDFDRMWNNCLKDRRGNVIFTIVVLPFSWINISSCYLLNRTPLGFNWWLKPLPDKEKFRKKVTGFNKIEFAEKEIDDFVEQLHKTSPPGAN